MREIKFRAWDKKSMAYSEDYSGLSQFFKEEGGNTLIQFTGLKDKKGKEIYEGDILKMIHCKSFGKNNIWYFYIYLVEVEQDYNYGYRFNWKRVEEKKIPTKTKEDYKIFKEDFKIYGRGEIIIGNIYENPELLKDASQLKNVRGGK